MGKTVRLLPLERSIFSFSAPHTVLTQGIYSEYSESTIIHTLLQKTSCFETTHRHYYCDTLRILLGMFTTIRMPFYLYFLSIVCQHS